jgi:hypothetical protein
MLLDAGRRARAMAIWQASCELEIVPSLHSNRGAGTVSATGSGLAGTDAVVAGEAVEEAVVEDAVAEEGCTAAGGGACATSFWKSAHPAHDNVINRARAERTCSASGKSPRRTNPSACGGHSIQRRGVIRTHAGRGGEGGLPMFNVRLVLLCQ